ncbi:hypothetical protein FOA52_002460 [Chlamydomonas sp. UWO 241]|nr:hypothetical protein FOA52_002460 [Chlamydomonas sp. UWO 241]
MIPSGQARLRAHGGHALGLALALFCMAVHAADAGGEGLHPRLQAGAALGSSAMTRLLLSGAASSLAIANVETQVPFALLACAGAGCGCDYCDTLLANKAFAPVETLIFQRILSGGCADVVGLGRGLVVDVGVNMGYFTVMSAVHGCRVLGFEPNIKPRAYAHASVDLNAVSHLVTIVAAGVDNHRGHGQMVHDAEWGIGAVAEAPSAAGPDSEVTEFPLVPLADAVREHALLIKVDTEGHEGKVFSNASEAFFQRHGADNILVEVKEFDTEAKRVMLYNIFIWGGFAAVYNYAEFHRHGLAEAGDVMERLTDVTDVVRSKAFHVNFADEDFWFVKVELDPRPSHKLPVSPTTE